MHPASPARRALALLIDLWILQLPTAVVARLFALSGKEQPLGSFRYPGFSFHLQYSALVLVLGAVFVLGYVCFESGTSIGSPGKALLGLRLEDEEGAARLPLRTSFFRSLLRLLLLLLWPLLPVYALLARDRRFPHDRWTGVGIVRKARRPLKG